MKAAEQRCYSTRLVRLGADKNGLLVLNLRQPSRRPVGEVAESGRGAPVRHALDRVLDYLFAP